MTTGSSNPSLCSSCLFLALHYITSCNTSKAELILKQWNYRGLGFLKCVLFFNAMLQKNPLFLIINYCRLMRSLRFSSLTFWDHPKTHSLLSMRYREQSRKSCQQSSFHNTLMKNINHLEAMCMNVYSVHISLIPEGTGFMSADPFKS